MISVRVGDSWERDQTEINLGELAQQLNRQGNGGQLPCVRVTINESGVNVVLGTHGCPSRPGRPPTQRERRIYELWVDRGLNRAGWTVGNLISFLQQLRHVL